MTTAKKFTHLDLIAELADRGYSSYPMTIESFGHPTTMTLMSKTYRKIVMGRQGYVEEKIMTVEVYVTSHNAKAYYARYSESGRDFSKIRDYDPNRRALNAIKQTVTNCGIAIW